MRGDAELTVNPQLEAASHITPEDKAASREFWRYWGTHYLTAC